ncbi:MAG: hypothetical protein ABJB11_15065 [Ferruginibacter sp.]
MHAPANTSVAMQLPDALGHTIADEKIILIKGKNQQQLNAGAFAAKQYYLTIVDAESGNRLLKGITVLH